MLGQLNNDNVPESEQINEYNRVKDLVLSKNHIFFEGDNFDLNCIWERTNNEITNMFTDFFHILYKENGIEKIITIKGTTKPGIKGSIDSPITYEGITGTAIIIPGQYRKSWQLLNGGKKYPFDTWYFQQIQGICYWRDGDKDLVIDEVQEQDNKIFGTNWHKMGEPINNWSLGCMGFHQKDFESLMLPVFQKAISIFKSNIFTGTIIESF